MLQVCAWPLSRDGAPQRRGRRDAGSRRFARGPFWGGRVKRGGLIAAPNGGAQGREALARPRGRGLRAPRPGTSPASPGPSRPGKGRRHRKRECERRRPPRQTGRLREAQSRRAGRWGHACDVRPSAATRRRGGGTARLGRATDGSELCSARGVWTLSSEEHRQAPRVAWCLRSVPGTSAGD